MSSFCDVYSGMIERVALYSYLIYCPRRSQIVVTLSIVGYHFCRHFDNKVHTHVSSTRLLLIPVTHKLVGVGSDPDRDSGLVGPDIF
jgi:hypothetical protein